VKDDKKKQIQGSEYDKEEGEYPPSYDPDAYTNEFDSTERV